MNWKSFQIILNNIC